MGHLQEVGTSTGLSGKYVLVQLISSKAEVFKWQVLRCGSLIMYGCLREEQSSLAGKGTRALWKPWCGQAVRAGDETGRVD